MVQPTKQNCKHFPVHLTSTLAKDFLHQLGRRFELGIANVHQLLGRRFQLIAKDFLQPLVRCSNSVVKSTNFSISCSSQVSNASLIIDASPFPRISLAVALCALPRGTKRKLASKLILRKRHVLPLLLPLRLLLTAPNISPRLAVCTDHCLRPSQCETVFRNHCFAERFGLPDLPRFPGS